MCKGICLSGFPLTASHHISSSAFPTGLHWWHQEIPPTATRFRSTNQAQEFALQYFSVPWNKNYVGVGCKCKRNLIFCPTTWSWWMKLVNQTLRKKGGDKSGDKKRLWSVVQKVCWELLWWHQLFPLLLICLQQCCYAQAQLRPVWCTHSYDLRV